MVWGIALTSVIALLLIMFIARGVLGMGASPEAVREQTIRSMVAAQRGAPQATEEEEDESSYDAQLSVGGTRFDTPLQIEPPQTIDYRLTLQKKLKFAQLSNIPPWTFTTIQIVLSVAAFVLVQMVFGPLLQVMALLVGPFLVNLFINWRMERRFAAFDRDYPQFLLSFVGMLKTGLNVVQALEAAASNLEHNSLVRLEVELMLERLRLGVTEERSIGSFGEDVNHPEIELFVQALLLSRRVGGNLSETIERLSKQVRKRQSFRRAAVAAVGLQRGSIVFILAILIFLEGYLYFVWPECITLAWTTPATAPYVQGALAFIILGWYLVYQVTKIKV